MKIHFVEFALQGAAMVSALSAWTAWALQQQLRREQKAVGTRRLAAEGKQDGWRRRGGVGGDVVPVWRGRRR